MPNPFANDVAAIFAALRPVLDRVDGESVTRLCGAILSAPAIFFAGAGRSGLVQRCAAMRFMHMGLPVRLVGDTLTPAIAAGELLLVASGSGETAGPVALARMAKALDARVALVTANPASTLAGLADATIVLDLPSPESGLRAAHPMGSLFEEALFLFFEALILELMRRKNLTSAEMFKRHANLE